MFTEIFLFFPVFALYYLQFINVFVLAPILGIYYWIPKYATLSIMKKFFPSIVMNNVNSDNNNINSNGSVKKIALTFDDVPYGQIKTFEEILFLLNKNNNKGTFFIISDYFYKQVRDDTKRNVFLDAIKNDHLMANHGKTDSMHAILSERYLRSELSQCDYLIQSLYNSAGKNFDDEKMKIYRPGCGVFTSSMIDVAKKSKYKIVLGSVYPHDPIVPFAIINFWNIISKLEHGDIVILHDRSWTIPLLKLLLPWMEKNNFKSVTVQDLLC